jgi:hypothetical protein
MVLFPLSFGPAAWLMTNDYLGEENANLIMRMYIPLLDGLHELMPEPVWSAYIRYCEWWYETEPHSTVSP